MIFLLAKNCLLITTKFPIERLCPEIFSAPHFSFAHFLTLLLPHHAKRIVDWIFHPRFQQLLRIRPDSHGLVKQGVVAVRRKKHAVLSEVPTKLPTHVRRPQRRDVLLVPLHYRFFNSIDVPSHVPQKRYQHKHRPLAPVDQAVLHYFGYDRWEIFLVYYFQLPCLERPRQLFLHLADLLARPVQCLDDQRLRIFHVRQRHQKFLLDLHLFRQRLLFLELLDLAGFYRQAHKPAALMQAVRQAEQESRAENGPADYFEGG